MTMTKDMPPLPDRATLDRLLEKTKGRLFFMKQAGITWVASGVCSHAFIWDETAPTAWCNGTTIGINPAFFLGLTWEARMTLLAHEACHTLNDHFDRIGKRDPQLWNMAADYVINNDLMRMGFSFEGLEFGCLDTAYANMSTEQVYDLLEKEPPTQSPMGMDLDMRPAPDNERPQRISIAVNAQQAAISAGEAGSIPGEAQEAIKALLNPVLPWHVLLERFLNERNQDDYSWRRPNRRHDDFYLPSLLSNNGLEHLLYFFDVSGSVTKNQTARCLTELISLHGNLQPNRITLATFDTEIQDVFDFYEDDVINEIVINGRGGTDLSPVYDMIKTHNPTAAVVFSDLDCDPMENPGVPVIWIILDNPDAVPDYGVAIHLDTRKLK